MNIEYYKVTKEILKRYVDYFYILKEDQPIEISYLAFPHYNTPVCFIKNHVAKFEGNHTIYEEKMGSVAVVGWGMVKAPINIKTTGPLYKIAIVFKPLGLNNFIRENFSSVISQNGSAIFAWEDIGEKLYALNESPLITEMLEKFLIEKYLSFEYQQLLEKAISLLIDFGNSYSVSDICVRLNIHPRKIHRLFVQHLGCSPTDFRKIIRFRQSVENQSRDGCSLTKLALESHFYDQSDFIKAFKSLTLKKPSSFFKQVERHANNNFVLEVLRS